MAKVRRRIPKAVRGVNRGQSGAGRYDRGEDHDLKLTDLPGHEKPSPTEMARIVLHAGFFPFFQPIRLNSTGSRQPSCQPTPRQPKKFNNFFTKGP